MQTMKVYRNATIITVDSKRRVFKNGALAVQGNLIVDVGASDEILDRYKECEQVDCNGNILLPGLINTHLHLAQCLMRGMADDLPLLDWLTKRIWPVQGAYSHESFLASARVGMAELLLSGTTTFVESMFVSHYGLDGLIEAIYQNGIRGVIAKVVMEPMESMLLPSNMTETRDMSFAEAVSAHKKWNGAFDERVKIWLGPRITSMFNENLLREVKNYMDEYGFYTTMHYAETPEDVASVLDATGYTPAQFLRSLGLAGKDMLLVHCTALPPGDEAILGEEPVNVAYCPISNMKTAFGICRSYDMLQNGVNVTLGTDAPACDNNSDMVMSMRIGASLQKLIKDDPIAITAEESIEMATINGARAIGMDSLIGSLEKGKRADFIVIDIHKPHMCPHPNPVSAVVYAANGGDVKTVVIDGKTVVDDYRLLTIDVEQCMENALRTEKDIRKKLAITDDDLMRWKYHD